MSIFKGATIFIGWLTGSLAGIAAILYAFGFLIVRAQLNLLGLVGLFEYGNEYYLLEGAKFFVVLFELIGQEIVLPLLVTILVFISPVILILLLLFYLSKKIDRLGEFGDKLKNKMSVAWKEWARTLKVLGFIVLLFILLFHLIPDLGKFRVPLGISNLLYVDSSNLQDLGEDERGIADSLVRGDQEGRVRLTNLFVGFLIKGLEAALLLVLAWRLTSDFRFRSLKISLFAIILMIYTVFLPMIYGVLMRPIRYPNIKVDSSSKMLTNCSGSFFLLNKTNSEFVLWDPSQKKVFWIPKQDIEGIEVKQIESLFNQNKN